MGIIDELLSAGVGSRQDNVVTLLRLNPQYSVLVKALELTGLSKTLQSGRDFTVFARDKMLDNVDDLRKTLLRHVVRARLTSLRIPSGVSQVDTVAGDKLTIARLSGRIALYNCEGAAEVVEADLIAGNGIVHTIDTII